MTALVDPPTAAFTRMAFSNASRVRIFDRRTSWSTISTMRRPARCACAYRRESTAGNRRVAGQRQPERLDHRGHRGRGAHDVARAGRTGHAGLGQHELLARHAAGLDVLAEPPDVGARSEILPAELAVQHRAAGDDDRGHVTAGRAHDERRRGLVAARRAARHRQSGCPGWTPRRPCSRGSGRAWRSAEGWSRRATSRETRTAGRQLPRSRA